MENMSGEQPIISEEDDIEEGEFEEIDNEKYIERINKKNDLINKAQELTGTKEGFEEFDMEELEDFIERTEKARVENVRKEIDGIIGDVEQNPSMEKSTLVSENEREDKEEAFFEVATSEEMKKKKEFMEKAGTYFEEEAKKIDIKGVGKETVKTIFNTAASVAGLRAFYDVPRYLNQRFAVRGNIMGVGKGKGLEGSLENLLAKSQAGYKERGEKQDNEEIKVEDNKKKKGGVIDKIKDLDKRLSKTKEGSTKHSEQRKLLAKILWENKHTEVMDKEKRSKEIKIILDDYTTTKVDGATAVRESLNTACVAFAIPTAGTAMKLRILANMPLSAIGKRNEMKKEVRIKAREEGLSEYESKKLEKETDIFKAINRGIKETYEGATFKGSKTKKEKFFKAIKSYGNIARIAGIAGTAFITPDAYGEAANKLLDVLEKKDSWSDLGGNFLKGARERITLGLINNDSSEVEIDGTSGENIDDKINDVEVTTRASEYQGGNSVWKESENQLKLALGEETDEAMVRRMTQFIERDPESYGLAPNTYFAEMSVDDIKSVDWNKALNDTISNKNLPPVSTEDVVTKEEIEAFISAPSLNHKLEEDLANIDNDGAEIEIAEKVIPSEIINSKVDINFDSKYDNLQRTEIQDYCNSYKNETEEMVDQFQAFEEKYKDKPEFKKFKKLFEREIDDRDRDLDRLVKKAVKGVDFDKLKLKVDGQSFVYNDFPAYLAQERLEEFAKESDLRTDEEIFADMGADRNDLLGDKEEYMLAKKMKDEYYNEKEGNVSDFEDKNEVAFRDDVSEKLVDKNLAENPTENLEFNKITENLRSNPYLRLDEVNPSFADKYTEFERENLTNYINSEIEERNELLSALNEYKNKYGDREQFSKFQRLVENHIKIENNKISSMLKGFNDPEKDYNAQFFSVGGGDNKMLVDSLVERYSQKSGLLSRQELENNSFNELTEKKLSVGGSRKITEEDLRRITPKVSKEEILKKIDLNQSSNIEFLSPEKFAEIKEDIADEYEKIKYADWTKLVDGSIAENIIEDDAIENSVSRTIFLIKKGLSEMNATNDPEELSQLRQGLKELIERSEKIHGSTLGVKRIYNESIRKLAGLV